MLSEQSGEQTRITWHEVAHGVCRGKAIDKETIDNGIPIQLRESMRAWRTRREVCPNRLDERVFGICP
jgi:hypothetical protein